MSRDKRHFRKFKSLGGGLVTFRDGSTSTIKGWGSIDISGLPTFHNVLFVNSLKANLSSISQFYDKNHIMYFSKDESNIYNRVGKWIIKGTRTLDNYYGVSNLNHFELL
jgi:hypothetical protein